MVRGAFRSMGWGVKAFLVLWLAVMLLGLVARQTGYLDDPGHRQAPPAREAR